MESQVACLAVLHHLAELVKVDFSISIDVDLCDVFFDLFLGWHVAHIDSSEELKDFDRIDFTRLVGIKHIKYHLKIFLPHIGLGIHGCSKKLGIVDLSRSVGISCNKHLI